MSHGGRNAELAASCRRRARLATVLPPATARLAYWHRGRGVVVMGRPHQCQQSGLDRVLCPVPVLDSAHHGDVRDRPRRRVGGPACPTKGHPGPARNGRRQLGHLARRCLGSRRPAPGSARYWTPPTHSRSPRRSGPPTAPTGQRGSPPRRGCSSSPRCCAGASMAYTSPTSSSRSSAGRASP